MRIIFPDGEVGSGVSGDYRKKCRDIGRRARISAEASGYRQKPPQYRQEEHEHRQESLQHRQEESVHRPEFPQHQQKSDSNQSPFTKASTLKPLPRIH